MERLHVMVGSLPSSLFSISFCFPLPSCSPRLLSNQTSSSLPILPSTPSAHPPRPGGSAEVLVLSGAPGHKVSCCLWSTVGEPTLRTAGAGVCHRQEFSKEAAGTRPKGLSWWHLKHLMGKYNQNRKTGLTRRRKTAGLDFAPVHQLFQRQTDFLASLAGPGPHAAREERGTEPRKRPRPGAQRPKRLMTVSGTWNMSHTILCLTWLLHL